jgi:hypothetical protein
MAGQIVPQSMRRGELSRRDEVERRSFGRDRLLEAARVSIFGYPELTTT